MVHPAGTAHFLVVAVATAVMLYTSPVNAGHFGVVPLIAPGTAGVPGFTVTAFDEAVLVPQVLPAVTVILPFCPAVPVVTVIDVVPAPAVIVHPAGPVHVYVVALATAVMV